MPREPIKGGDKPVKPAEAEKPAENVATSLDSSADVKKIREQIKEKPKFDVLDLLVMVKPEIPFNKVLRNQMDTMPDDKLKGWDLFDHVYKIAVTVQVNLKHPKLPKAKLALLSRNKLYGLLQSIVVYYDRTRKNYNYSLGTEKAVLPNEQELLKLVAEVRKFDTTLLKRENPANDEEAEKLYHEQEETLEIKKREDNFQQRSIKIYVPSIEVNADLKRREEILMSKSDAEGVLRLACYRQGQKVPETALDKARILINELYAVGRNRAAEADYVDAAAFNEAGVTIQEELVPAIIRIVAEDPKLFMDASVQTALKTMEEGLTGLYKRALDRHSDRAWVNWSDTVDTVGGGGKLVNAMVAYENRLLREAEAEAAKIPKVSTDAAAGKPKEDMSFLFQKGPDGRMGLNQRVTEDADKDKGKDKDKPQKPGAKT